MFFWPHADSTIEDEYWFASSIPTSTLLLVFREWMCSFSFESAYIALQFTIVKKVGLDSTDLKSYRPISNLSVVYKLLEQLVAKYLVV